MLLPLRPCFAGWGTPIYSTTDGIIKITGPNAMEWTKPYYAPPGSGFGGGEKSANYHTGNLYPAGVGEVKFSGTIKVSVPWEGSDPVPKCVIFKETATASWSGSSGSGSDGLGGIATGSSGDEDGAPGGSCSTTKYKVVTPADNAATSSDAPEAHAELPMPYHGLLNATASVSYTVEVIPVEIGLSGTLKLNGDPTNYLMVGQGLKATLSCGVGTLTTPIWHVTGGMPFSGWYADAHTTNCSIFEDGEATDTLHVYFTVKDEVAVSCNATVTFSDGTSKAIQAEKIVSVKSPVDDPNFAVPGRVLVSQANIYTTGGNPNDPDPINNATHGITWYGQLDTPAPFKLNQGNGNWHFLQTFTFGRWYTPENRYDAPSQPFFQNSISHRIQEPFETWMMFKPPSANASHPDEMWVPIGKHTWHWSGTATRPNVQAMWSGSGSILLDSSAATYEFPIWTFNVVNGHIVP